MVADNESDVVDSATNDETALLHEDPPAPAPGILHDDVHRSRVLQTLLKHRPVLNRLPVGVGDTAAGRLDTRHSVIDLGTSVTNLPADTLEEMRRPRELKPDVELEPFFGVRVSVRPRANGAGYQEEVASMQAGKTSSTGVGRMPRSSRVNACRPTTLSRDISFT